MQLQLHYTNYITPQLQLRYTTTTTTAALHHTTSSSCGWGDRPGDHCNHCSPPKKHSSNHLWVHQWIRSAIHPWFTTTNLSYRLSIFETSATALCGTTGIYIYTHTYRIHVHHFLQLCVRMFVYGILRPQSCYIGTLGLTQPLHKYMDPCGSLFQSEVAVVEGTHWACHNAPRKAVALSLLILDVCAYTRVHDVLRTTMKGLLYHMIITSMYTLMHPQT